MKKQIVSAFEEVTMPVDCEKKISRAVAGRKAERQPGLRRKPIAAAAALALVLALTACTSPVVLEAVQKFFFPEIGMAVYEKEDALVVTYDPESPAFAEIREGRLYFTGNGEDLDITDRITEEKPFFYTYQDESGIEIALVVGYAGTIENFGIYQFLRYSGEPWFTGTGRNILNEETETRYPWVDLVWKELEIPWPMPEG